MLYRQNWQGFRITKEGRSEPFDAAVPGNIQEDYGRSQNYPDVMYGTNCTMYEPLEDDAWEYRTKLSYRANPGESVWFVSHGIDYRYDILLDGKKIYAGEGMFSDVEIDLTDLLQKENELCVYIYPHPKRPGAYKRTRDEADESCKPPVCYGWDWNPRLLISGMWQDAYLETRTNAYINRCEPRYKLASDYSFADVDFTVDCNEECTVELFDPDGKKVYSGTKTSFRVENPKLWWCQGQGEPNLYRWTVRNKTEERSGRIGFRRVKLLRNIGANDPHGFPKSRYAAPITVELNGRRIFMKGSNWVNPEIFWGRIKKETYEPLLGLVKDANMNILRLWGGAAFCKESFYDLCDEMGIMVWQEFMLACNAYPNDEHYLSVLEKEARFMIEKLRSHACLALWCGGNELFNGWSGMNDQSLPLRLLDKLCYDLDRDHSFLKTSPLEGMGHGGYMFFDEKHGGDPYQCFQSANCTAYTEFGVPSISEMKALKEIIPPEEIDEIRLTDSWQVHHAIKAWMPQSHACTDILKKYFGSEGSTEDRIEQSDWLQCEGLKAIFEEARKQAPHCSGALNWCFNEPWITAANCSIVRYPAVPKPGYYAVQKALRGSLFSARIPKFDWKSGEKFQAEIWLLNDKPEAITASVEVFLKVGTKEIPLLSWKNATAPAGENTQGAKVCCVLPDEEAESMTLVLRSDDSELDSEYRLPFRLIKFRPAPKAMNM